VLLLPLLALLGAGAVLKTEAGTRRLLAFVPGVQVHGSRGALWSDRFAAERIVVDAAGTHVVIEGFELDGARWTLLPHAAAWVGLHASAARARRVEVQTAKSAEPAREPATLRLPLRLQLDRAAVGDLQVDGTALRDASAAVHLGADDGRSHRVADLALQWERVRAKGSARIGADRPFTLEARAAVDAAGAPGSVGSPVAEVHADVQAAGPLAAIDLRAALRGTPRPGHAAPTADASVQLRPFAAWPLGTADARAQALDLAAFSQRAPRTQLDARVQLASTGVKDPWRAQVQIDNAAPGRWDEGRLPFAQLRAQLAARADEPQRVDIDTFDLRLADAAGPAGRWQGSGRWDAGTATLDTRIAELEPQRLDRRAAAMRLSGPLALVLHGLPSPDPRRAEAPSAPAAPGAATRAPAWKVEARGSLEGRLDPSVQKAPQPATLTFDLAADAQSFELKSLQARSGAATARAQAQGRRGTDARWTIASTGELHDFDPLPWVPGPEGSAWRRGPHRLSGTWKLDLELPARTAQRSALQWLQTVQGDARIELADSLLAGVALRGLVQLASDPAAAPAQRSRAHAEARLAGNRITIDGSGDPAGAGAADRWRVAIDAPVLAELAPLFALHPQAAAWAPRQGRVEGTVGVEGRWPLLHTTGEATVDALRAGELALGRARVDWTMDTGRGRTVALRADVADAAFGANRVARLRGEVAGTLAQHRIDVAAALPLAPPPALETWLGLRTAQGTQLQLAGEGAWEEAAEGGGRWRALARRLAAAPWDGLPELRADASWLDTRELRAELRVDRDGRVAGASADAGRAVLAGNVGLRWNEIRWQAAAGPGQVPRWALQAEVEPVALAPLLQRVPSAMRWGGDLRVGARLDIAAGERFDADVRIERRDGDLNVTDDTGTTALGITDAELVLVAHDGQWRVTPLVAGAMLGVLSGNATLRTAPQRTWPDAQAPLDGAMHFAVPDLGIWARWLPPGWRLSGALSSTARLAGRLGAPEYTGELQASNVALRSLLQGVAYRDGELLVALRGDTAVIERGTLHAGEGTLHAEGGARFGAAPNARLKVTAHRFRVIGRSDRQLVASGEAALALAADRLDLRGDLAVDSGLFDLGARDAPALDGDVNVQREPVPGAEAPGRAEPAPVPPVLRNAAVALDVNLGRALRLRGRGIDTHLRGQLHISTPGGRLAVHGAVRAEDGTYAAYGQKLEIDRGIVAFAGPVDSPRLDILALRPNLDVRVGVAVTGTALAPRVRLVSEPEMSETEKLSWLVLGRAPDGLGRADTALLQRAALALLAGEGETPTDAVLRAIGLDDLSVRQSEGDVRETVVSLGKQLGRRWYVGYERSVNATTGTWQLVYRVAQRFTLRAQSGLENSLDLIWTWRFH
jgi:translocation and assembly module TamB